MVYEMMSGLACLQDVPILCGDINDQASVDAVVKNSRVVLSTAGPYALMGTPVVDACVRMRTHYCDLTGIDIFLLSLRLEVGRPPPPPPPPPLPRRRLHQRLLLGGDLAARHSLLV